MKLLHKIVLFPTRRACLRKTHPILLIMRRNLINYVYGATANGSCVVYNQVPNCH